jgi:hypothetical protein
MSVPLWLKTWKKGKSGAPEQKNFARSPDPDASPEAGCHYDIREDNCNGLANNNSLEVGCMMTGGQGMASIS